MTAPRPDVVQAYFDALTSMDPTKISGLTSMTPEERDAAEQLFAASRAAGAGQRSRDDEALIWLARPEFDGVPMSQIARDHPEIWAEYQRRCLNGPPSDQNVTAEDDSAT